MSELKPCPKCNGPATMIEGSYDYDGGDRYYAFSAKFVCAECGLSFEVYNDWPKRFGPCESMWDFAIEAWNTRNEPTCRVEAMHAGPGIFEYELSCGHGCEWTWPVPPAFCPSCGARVKEEE